jgi:ubiquinone biosynthesis protein COQ9
MMERKKMSKREKLKQQILKRALVHVSFERWSQAVLEQAAFDVTGDASYGWRLFPKGPLEAVSYWSALLDQEMLASLPAPEAYRVRARVALAVKIRLQLLGSTKEAARKTTAYLALPQNMPEASRLLYATVNEIWYYAGDTATDYNFYTKRGLLAWVYSATFLYWLRDKSDEYEATWTFLGRRIDEVLKVPQLPKMLMERLFFWKRHG